VLGWRECGDRAVDVHDDPTGEPVAVVDHHDTGGPNGAGTRR
jgi:hypothetical protein